MKRIVDGKTHNIPDDFIRKNIANGIVADEDEAVDLWLSDEGIVVDETVLELTAKAKETGIAHDAGMKAKRKAPERKPDEVKRAVVAALAKFIGTQDGVKDVDVTNIERMIAFSLGGDNFEITLTKKRKPKN